jgi:hypothetical protein
VVLSGSEQSAKWYFINRFKVPKCPLFQICIKNAVLEFDEYGVE